MFILFNMRNHPHATSRRSVHLFAPVRLRAGVGKERCVHLHSPGRASFSLSLSLRLRTDPLGLLVDVVDPLFVVNVPAVGLLVVAIVHVDPELTDVRELV